MRRNSDFINFDLDVVGAIPQSWTKSKNKYILREKTEIVGANFSNYKLLSLTKEGVIFRDVESAKGKFPESFDCYKIVDKNELIFCLFDVEETPRCVGISAFKGMITGAYNIYAVKINPKFVFYWYLNIDSVKGLRPYYTGMRNVIRYDTFMSLKICYPPLPVQEKIVKYLDQKTALIDKLIFITERKIELLKEKRTALINRAVTKGLDPHLKMKDSGIEWIGEIPEHWDCIPIKFTTKNFTTKSVPSKDSIKISPENVLSNLGICTNFHSEYEGEGVEFIAGDILLNKLRIYLKKILLAESDGYSMGEMIVLRTNQLLFNKFFFYLLFHDGLIGYLNSQSEGVKLPRVSVEVIMNSRIPVPPFSMQKEIVSYLDQELHKYTKIADIELGKITKLKEYKQTLISEVVTGKINVEDEV